MADRVVVLDQSWTPDRPDPRIIPIHELIGPALVAANGFEGAFRRIDAWAEDVAAVQALTVDGVSWWFRIREGLVAWLHERLVWRAVVDQLERMGPIDLVRIPETETALTEVIRGSPIGEIRIVASGSSPPVDGLAASRRRRPASRQVLGRLGKPSIAPTAGSAAPPSMEDLDRRVERLKVDRRLMVLTNTGIQEWVTRPRGDHRLVDPILGPVIDRLRANGEPPSVIALGLDHRDRDRWERARDDEDLLPASILASRWARPDDDGEDLGDAIRRLRDPDAAPLVVDECDLSEAVHTEVKATVHRIVATSLRQVPRVGRMIEELRPRAILLTHEGIRTPWLIAARRAGVPIHAVQHGVIYPKHPGYRHPRSEAWPLPDRIHVFGSFEASVLVEVGGYRLSEVDVSGSPRARAHDRDGEDSRAEVRAELGVAPGDRLLLISTTFSGLGRRYLLHALRSVLNGPLPGVHLLFKQHPGESDDGPYRALVEGIAEAGGWSPPPVSVLRGQDLYRLLRAADAHLGYHSTVLTDAVVAGTANLIADVPPTLDPVGYVKAGVARPIRDHVGLLDALRNPTSFAASSRAAFLARHFREGDAAGRIVDDLTRWAAVDGTRT
jgi:hypothetical protein